MIGYISSLKLNIAVDARPLTYPNTGIGRYTSSLLSILIQKTPGCTWLLYNVFQTPRDWESYPNVIVRNCNLSRGMFSSVASQFIYLNWLRLDKPRIFWSPRHHVPIFKVSGVSYVVSIHDLVWSRHPRTMAPFGRLLENILMPRSISIADQVFCASEFTKSEVESEYGVGDKLSVVTPASSLSSTSSYRLADQSLDTLLFVGTWEPRKNLSRLLTAFRNAIAILGRNLKLKLVGSPGWGGVNIHSMIAERSLGGLVEIHESINDEALRQIFLESNVLALPSIYEGFGIPLVEAMSFGLPVITSNVASMPEVVGDAAILVDPYNIDDITDAIVEVFSNDKRYELLSKNAVLSSEKYSWEKSAGVVMNYLSSFKS